MTRLAAVLFPAFLAAGCVQGRSMAQGHGGMRGEQVSAAIGPPDLTTNTAGRECARYTVLKDFWSRVPWSMSDPYYVCYTNGKVDSFGRASVAHPS